MPEQFGVLLTFGSLLLAGNVVGGVILTQAAATRHSLRVLRGSLGVGAGFMLAAVFFEVVPQVIAMWTTESGATEAIIAQAMTLVLGGYLIVFLVENLVAPHFHLLPSMRRENEDAADEISSVSQSISSTTSSTRISLPGIQPKTAYTALAGLSVHTFFDGVLLATGFLVGYEFGFILFTAIFLHKIPEGFTAASFMVSAGGTMRQGLMATVVIGLITIAGVLTVAFLSNSVSELVRYALPFSAGVTLYVAASDLIPEIKHREANFLNVLSVLIGVALFYLLHLLLELH